MTILVWPKLSDPQLPQWLRWFYYLSCYLDKYLKWNPAQIPTKPCTTTRNALLGNKWRLNFVAGLAAGASTKRRPNLAPGPKNTAIPVDALVRVRGLQKLTAHRSEGYRKKIVTKSHVHHSPPSLLGIFFPNNA